MKPHSVDEERSHAIRYPHSYIEMLKVKFISSCSLSFWRANAHQKTISRQCTDWKAMTIHRQVRVYALKSMGTCRRGPTKCELWMDPKPHKSNTRNSFLMAKLSPADRLLFFSFTLTVGCVISTFALYILPLCLVASTHSPDDRFDVCDFAPLFCRCKWQFIGHLKRWHNDELALFFVFVFSSPLLPPPPLSLCVEKSVARWASET